MSTYATILTASAIGILPAFLWLWFWLKEDKRRPEPKGLLVVTFLAGAVMVGLALPLEWIANKTIEHSAVLILAWAATEELLKYGAFAAIALKSKHFDEPVDAVIYALTAALGFSAAENFLYVWNTIGHDGVAFAVFNGNLRFVGATILHTACTGIVGVALGFSFFKGKIIKALALSFGMTLAISLHAIFNLFIIRAESIAGLLVIFSSFWVIIILLILAFERIKKMKYPKTC